MYPPAVDIPRKLILSGATLNGTSSEGQEMGVTVTRYSVKSLSYFTLTRIV